MSDKTDSTPTEEEKQATVIDALEALTGATSPPKPAHRAAPPAAIATTGQLPPRDYDMSVITDFLDRVFHAGLEDDEHVLTWAVSPAGHPSFPKSEAALEEQLTSSKLPKALYFGTAVCQADPDDSRLYNRKSLFGALHVVILDDIGTKVPLDRIPENFPPSYKLETSEGNFQYGYILDEPVDDLAAAEALIQLVYESGCSDEGGKMPNKLVRMPEGVNGKPGKGGFISRLTDMTDKNYSPQDILDALELNVSWADVLEDAESITKKRASNSIGATPWSSVAPVASALNGVIDPVLEWLYESGQVLTDNGGEWVDIKCPWDHEHSTGDATAGYVPIGRGEDVCMRGFHCFHDACAAQHTPEFLKYVSAASGIEAAIRDPAALLVTQYVFDPIANAAWDIKAYSRETMIPMVGFSNLHPHATTVYDVDGKPKKAGMVALWKTSPARVIVNGATYDPSTTARIVEQNEAKFVNLYSAPEWGKGPIDMTHVEKFQDYLAYLIPDDNQREYFLHWLTAKVQDMSFRGAAIVMVADKQGIGRSTLGDMITEIIGQSNVGDVALSEVLGKSDFNEWREKPFIIVEETLAGGPRDFYANYEKLKGFVDPRATTVTVNPKFGRKRTIISYASFLFLSNHANALALPEEDRRFYVIKNANNPAAPAVFTALKAWRQELDTDGMPLWARHVFRWLCQLPVDIEALTAPPPATDAKQDMADEALSDIDYAVDALVDLWPDPFMTASDVYATFRTPTLQGPLRFDDDANVKFIRRRIHQLTTAFPDLTIKAHGKTARPRVLNQYLGTREEGGLGPLTSEKVRSDAAQAIQAREIDYADLADKVADALMAADRL